MSTKPSSISFGVLLPEETRFWMKPLRICKNLRAKEIADRTQRLSKQFQRPRSISCSAWISPSTSAELQRWLRESSTTRITDSFGSNQINGQAQSRLSGSTSRTFQTLSSSTLRILSTRTSQHAKVEIVKKFILKQESECLQSFKVLDQLQGSTMTSSIMMIRRNLGSKNVCKKASLLKEMKRKSYFSLNGLRSTREIPLKPRTRTSKNRMKQTLASSKDSSRPNKQTLVPAMNCHTSDIRTTMSTREHNSLLLLVDYQLGLCAQIMTATGLTNPRSFRTSTRCLGLRICIISKSITQLVGLQFRFISLTNFRPRTSRPTEFRLKSIMLSTEANLRPSM